MRLKFLRKYFTIVFLFATLLGSLHHHKDFQQHSNCQICIVASSIANADTPVDAFYLTQLNIYHEPIFTQLTNFYIKKRVTSLQARAPPHIS